MEEAEEDIRGATTSRSITRSHMRVVLTRQATSNQLMQLAILMIITLRANLTLKGKIPVERKREKITTIAPANTPGPPRSPTTMINHQNNNTTPPMVAIKSLIRARGTKNTKRRLKKLRRNITSQRNNKSTVEQEITQTNHPMVATVGGGHLAVGEGVITPEGATTNIHHLTKIAATTEALKDMEAEVATSQNRTTMNQAAEEVAIRAVASQSKQSVGLQRRSFLPRQGVAEAAAEG